ncbi:MAG: hypothetical protein IIA50_04885, partial [Bacteroidetes bacterium]|nr:hypothetical protein [Bacteroidota bacterium]
EEVNQEVFISVYKNIHRFEFQSAFTTWLYRITIRRSVVSDVVRFFFALFERAAFFAIRSLTDGVLEIQGLEYPRVSVVDRRRSGRDKFVERPKWVVGAGVRREKLLRKRDS